MGVTRKDFYTSPYKRYAGSQKDNIKTQQRQLTARYTMHFSKKLSFVTTVYRTDFLRNWYKLDKVKDSLGEKIKIANLLRYPNEYENAYNIINGESSLNNELLLVKANNRHYYAKGVQSEVRYQFKTKGVTHRLNLGGRLHQDQVDRFQWVDEYTMEDGLMKLQNAGIHGTESNRVETAKAFASYVEYKLSYNKVIVTSGVRYENIFQERRDYGKNNPERIKDSSSIRHNRTEVLIPGVGVTYRANEYFEVFSGIHKGFAPAGSRPGVKPEESINYEVGTRYAKNALQGQLVLFLNDYSNLLGTNLEAGGGGGTNDLFNGGTVITKGMEFFISYDIFSSKDSSSVHIPISFSYTYTDARFQNSFNSEFDGWGTVNKGDFFPYLSRHQLGIVVGIEFSKYMINISGKYTGKMNTIPQGVSEISNIIPSYFIIDVGAEYKLSKNFNLFLNITNLTNKVYIVAERPSGLRPGMPLAFNFGVRTRF